MSFATPSANADDRAASGGPIVQMRGIAKHFGGVVALDSVDFDLRPGEVHALLGENGAGKSTLIKILAGVYNRDEGELRIGGNELPNHFTPAMVREAGLGFVHQDLGLIDELSVAENIALGCGYSSHGPLIDFSATARQATELLEAVSVEIPPKALVGELTQDQRVMVAVARAFSLDARAVVLDEVSSSLPAPDVRRLCEALVRSKQSGIGYVYVTHRLDELFGLADRVTVLRDGRLAATAELQDVSHADLVDWIVGEAKEAPAPRTRRAATSTGGGLVVRDLEGPELSAPATFSAARGEIVGVCGLVGSGSRALAALLGGGRRKSGGSVELDGEPLPVGDAVAMRRLSCAYVPGDRQREGGIGALTIRENLFLGAVGEQAGEGTTLHPRRERSEAAQLLEKFRVKPAGDPDRPLETLSGGNQQKVICGRALRAPTRLLVVDDPTAGVDVGARLDLHALMRACAAEGTIVILASTDFDEVALEADRALVMAHGAVVAELAGDELTAEALARASYVNSQPEEQK